MAGSVWLACLTLEERDEETLDPLEDFFASVVGNDYDRGNIGAWDERGMLKRSRL